MQVEVGGAGGGRVGAGGDSPDVEHYGGTIWCCTWLHLGSGSKQVVKNQENAQVTEIHLKTSLGLLRLLAR